jgi:hypothetical protein
LFPCSGAEFSLIAAQGIRRKAALCVGLPTSSGRRGVKFPEGRDYQEIQ